MIPSNQFHDIEICLTKIHYLDYAQLHFNDPTDMNTCCLYDLLILMMHPNSPKELPFSNGNLAVLYQLGLVRPAHPVSNDMPMRDTDFYISSLGSFLIRKRFSHYVALAIFERILMFLKRIFWALVLFIIVAVNVEMIRVYGSNSNGLPIIILVAFTTTVITPNISLYIIRYDILYYSPIKLPFKSLNITKGSFCRLLLRYYLNRSSDNDLIQIPKRALNNDQQLIQMYEHRLFAPSVSLLHRAVNATTFLL